MTDRARAREAMLVAKDEHVGFVVYTLQHIHPLMIYALTLAFLFLESSGVPILNTTLLLCTGALAALGRVNLALLFVLSIAGSVSGALSAYTLGKHYGEPLLLRMTRFLRIDEQKVRLAERWFAQAGARMIFVSRIVPYIRPFACFPAGIAEMPLPRFLLAASLGSTLWCSACLLIGWELGPRWKLALHLMRTYTFPTLGVLFALLVVFLLCKYSLMRTLKQRFTTENE